MQGDHKGLKGVANCTASILHVTLPPPRFENLRGSISGGRHKLTKIVSYERP